MKLIAKTVLFLIVLLFTFGAIGLAFSSPAPAQEPNAAQEVKYPQPLVEVWTMPGCSPCEWVKANAVPQWKRGAKVFVIDYTRWGTAAQRKGITAYPTIIVYTAEKKEVGRYTSGRPYSGDALTRAVQALITKASNECRMPVMAPVSSPVNANGVDSVISATTQNKGSGSVSDEIKGGTVDEPKNDIGFVPPIGAIYECEEGACKIGGLLDWSDDDADDEPIKEEEESPKGGADKSRGKGGQQSPLVNPRGDSTNLFTKPLEAIQEKIDEMKAEVKSSVMRAAILGSLIAMVIYAVLKTIFAGAFALLKTILIKARNWFCSSIASLTTKIAANVSEKVAEAKQANQNK